MQCNVDEIRILFPDLTEIEVILKPCLPRAGHRTHFEKVDGMFPNCESYRILALSSHFRVCVCTNITSHIFSTIWCFKPHKPHIFGKHMTRPDQTGGDAHLGVMRCRRFWQIFKKQTFGNATTPISQRGVDTWKRVLVARQIISRALRRMGVM